MKKFITLRANEYCRQGQWWLGEEAEIGCLLRPARIVVTQRGAEILQTSPFGVPFEKLAPFIVEQGFQVPASSLEGPKTKFNTTHEVAAAEKFQDDNADIIEPERQKRIETADPSYKKSSGVVIPNKTIKENRGDRIGNTPKGSK